MNFWANHFPNSLLLVSWMIWAGILVVFYPYVRKNMPNRFSWLVALIIMSALWTLHARLQGGTQDGMTYHLLGATLCTLILGMPSVLFLATFVAIIYTIIFHGITDLTAVGLNMLITVLPAVLWTFLMLKMARKNLPHHLFIFIFINAFFTAAIGMMLSGCLTIAVLDYFDIYSHETLWQNAFGVLFLLSWGDAFFTGLMTAIFIALSPYLLTQYSDQIYLQKKEKLF